MGSAVQEESGQPRDKGSREVAQPKGKGSTNVIQSKQQRQRAIDDPFIREVLDAISDREPFKERQAMIINGTWHAFFVEATVGSVQQDARKRR